MPYRKVTDAEAEEIQKIEEKAKVWKTNQPSNSSSLETTPNFRIKIVPKASKAAASSSEPHSHSSLVGTHSQAEDLPSECNAFRVVDKSQCVLLAVVSSSAAGFDTSFGQSRVVSML